MKENRTIDELTEGVAKEMLRMKYAAETIKILLTRGRSSRDMPLNISILKCFQRTLVRNI